MAKEQKTREEEAAEIQQHIFEQEVDDELRQEKLAALWKKYRFIVFGGIIAIIGGTIAMEWYQAWHLKVRMAESDRFENAVILSVQGKDDEAFGILRDLGKNAKTGYRFVAKMEEAGLMLKQKKIREASALLKELANDEKAPQPVRDAALLSYVGHNFDSGNTAELIQQLNPLVQNEKGAFYGPAVELVARMRMLSGDKEKAQTLLKKALENPDLTPQTKEILTLLSEKSEQ